MAVIIELQRLTPRQQEIRDEALRFNFLLLSRRFGKTTYSKILVGEKAIVTPNYYAAWSSPEWKFLLETFEEFYELLEPMKKRFSRDEKRLELKNGSVLDFWSSDNPSAGRGRKYHRWVADECQEQKQLFKFIYSSVRPTLADFRGDLYVLGTPNGEGSELHQLYVKWQEAEAAGYDTRIHHGTLYDNPYIDREEIAEMKRDMPPLQFEAEVMAKWVPFDGVTPLVYSFVWDSLLLIPEEYSRGKKVMSLDAAKQNDGCALTACWRDKITKEYYTDIDDVLLFNQRTELGEYDFAALEEVIVDWWRTGKFYAFTYDPSHAVMLAQRLRNRGVRCIEFTQNSMRTKSDSYLSQALSQGKYHHPGHPELTEHMLNATLKYTNTGLRIVKQTEKKKIDLAVATSMAVYQLSLLSDSMVDDYIPAYAPAALSIVTNDTPFAGLSRFSPF